jgi:hypothetical protein
MAGRCLSARVARVAATQGCWLSWSLARTVKQLQKVVQPPPG